MKSLLKVICAALMLTLASCAHHKHGGCEGEKHNCSMEKGSKECQECCKEGKCDMNKKDETKAEVKTEEVKAAAPAAAAPAEVKPEAKKEKKKK